MRFFDRRVALVAAVLLAVAFLPVHYAHFALNDAPTLAPVCLALAGAAGVLHGGRGRAFALAGLGLGVATAMKYTAGIVLLPLLVAGALAPLSRAARCAASCWRAPSPPSPSQSPTRTRCWTSTPSRRG